MAVVDRVTSRHKHRTEFWFSVVDSIYKVYGHFNIMLKILSISSCFTYKVYRCGVAGKIIEMRENSGL